MAWALFRRRARLNDSDRLVRWLLDMEINCIYLRFAVSGKIITLSFAVGLCQDRV